MLFDCTALLIGLYAAYMSKWKANQVFSYGYGRFEVLSGFVNGVFLVIIAFMVVVESLERLVDPPEVNTSKLLLVSVGGFLVNMVGIIFFHEHHGHAHTPTTECPMSHSHSHGDHQAHEAKHKHNFNMEGIFLHILADTLGSVGVIVSTLMIDKFHWYIADPICSLIISGLILASVVSLLRCSAHILTQRVPQHLESSLEACVSDLKHIDGVVSCVQPHFWTFTNEEVIGTARIVASPTADTQAVLRKALAVLTSYGVRKVTVQVEKERSDK